MPITLTVHGIDSLKSALINRKKETRKMFRKALYEGMSNFKRRTVEEQLSGRVSEDYGLNRVSGNAARSLDVTVEEDSYGLVARMTVNAKAWYLKVHQHFNFDGWIKNAFGKGIKVFIPKRLYIFEEWKQYGSKNLYALLKRRVGGFLNEDM
jgi:hypothetical protein